MPITTAAPSTTKAAAIISEIGSFQPHLMLKSQNRKPPAIKSRHWVAIRRV
ncbi:hypothetical protein D3C78_1502680 [compost metagenome]